MPKVRWDDHEGITGWFRGCEVLHFLHHFLQPSTFQVPLSTSSNHLGYGVWVFPLAPSRTFRPLAAPVWSFRMSLDLGSDDVWIRLTVSSHRSWSKCAVRGPRLLETGSYSMSGTWRWDNWRGKMVVDLRDETHFFGNGALGVTRMLSLGSSFLGLEICSRHDHFWGSSRAFVARRNPTASALMLGAAWLNS